MTSFIEPARIDNILGKASHRLYVEGQTQIGKKEKEAFDVQVMSFFLIDKGVPITVQGMGATFNVKNVAEALYQDHPRYYFLIDRDHQDDNEVEASWSKFPDPSTNNLLIWRKRELENYFLDPEYLSQSGHLRGGQDKLQKIIVEEANNRVFFDIANAVVIEVREKMRKNWIEIFPNISGFNSSKNALKKLLSRPEFLAKKKAVAGLVNTRHLEQRFDHYLTLFMDGESRPVFGRGHWLDRMKGKPLFKSVINRCFQVKDQQGRSLQGSERIMAVVKDLLRKPLPQQPTDFQELHRLMAERVAQS